MTLSQQGKTYEFDVIVIGSGLAGLHYCLQLLNLKPKINIALISKVEANECNSRYAQGGVAAVFNSDDSIASHIADTLKAGDGLCYRPSVESIIRQGPDAIKQLQHYSIQFNKTAEGSYVLAKEGGHSHRRIFNCGDQTGLNIIEALVNTARLKEQIHFFEHHIAVNLITHYHPHCVSDQGEVLGAYVLDSLNNCIHTFLASCVVLASGGAGKTYRYTSNPMVATGDGVAMAYRAGARVGNMEFYQFHPTLLHHHTINNFLISEAVRGEGGILKNADTGERFMARYAPQQMELATRDVVSRAIFNEIEQSQNSFVYLDITHQPKSFLKKRFPQIYNTLLSIGIEMSQDMIPVVPAAHYQCGGVLTDVNGQTDLKRLYAIGEVAFTGLHGANRLASNSLLEAVVMAGNAARNSIKDIATHWETTTHIPNWSSPSEVNARRASQINAHWRSLRGEMTSYAGIIRTEAGLEDLLQLIIKRHKIIEEYYWKHSITRDFIELRNIILNAELIVRAALSRRESRGGHFREDFPQKNKATQESIARLNSPQNPFI
ncbi:L-aspartate oxidase [Legionella septentrionalis]|uniref:L-aspartate oxidase n=1 Tax=Legionella septentrionalis TaxID=2498109 RepID=UPI000F8C877C|nr:L-aspartate oxidase [Legionella septentrionalis]RUR15482.1 L-aspartate oxidase [Legionella septentrionalis]